MAVDVQWCPPPLTAAAAVLEESNTAAHTAQIAGGVCVCVPARPVHEHECEGEKVL